MLKTVQRDCICGWSQGGFYIGGDFVNVLVEKLRFTVRGQEEKSISGRGNSFSKKKGRKRDLDRKFNI